MHQRNNYKFSDSRKDKSVKMIIMTNLLQLTFFKFLNLKQNTEQNKIVLASDFFPTFLFVYIVMKNTCTCSER